VRTARGRRAERGDERRSRWKSSACIGGWLRVVGRYCRNLRLLPVRCGRTAATNGGSPAEPIATRLEGRGWRGAFVVALSTAAYVGVFFLMRPLAPEVARMATALSIIPVAVAGWLLGTRGVVAIVVICIPLNGLLLYATGHDGWSVFNDPKGLFGTVLIVLVALGTGRVRNLYDQSRRELRERRRAERERDRLLNEATERARELSCMYGVARLIQTGATTEDVFRGTVALIPSGWRYPNVAAARVRFDGAEYASEGFAETPWILTRDIVVADQPRGTVEICYAQECPRADEGPFLREETHLIRGIARSLGEMVQRKEAEETARRETRVRAALAEIGRIVSSSPQAGDIYGGFAEQTRTLIPFDRIVITEIDREQDTLTDVYVWGTEVDGRAVHSNWRLRNDGDDRADGLRGVDCGEPIVLHGDAMRAAAERCREEAAAVEAGLVSALAVPIIWREQVIGSLNFRSSDSDAYPEEAVELAERVSAQIAGAIATSRLHSQALQDAREREVLAEIGRVISSTLDIDEVYEEFAVQVERLLPVDLLTVYVVDQRDRALIAEHVAKAHAAEIAPGDRLLLGQPAGEELFPHGQGRVFSAEAIAGLAQRMNVTAESLHAGFRSIMAVPLMSGDEMIGVLCLRSRQDAVYSERDLALAERVGAQIAGAIANSKLHEQAQRDAEERSTLAEIGRIVASSPNIEDAYDSFARQTKKLIRFDCMHVNMIDVLHRTGTVVFASQEIPLGRPVGDKFSLSRSMTEAMIQAGSGLLRGAESPEAIVTEFPSLASDIEDGVRSFLMAPLFAESSVIGTVSVTSREPDAYSPRDLALIESIAAQIAGTVANSRLHASLQHEAHERTVLAEIGRIIGSTLDINDVYERFVDQMQKLLRFDWTAITAVDLAAGTATPVHVKGEDMPDRIPGKAFPLAGTLAEAVIEQRSGIVTGSEPPEVILERFPGLTSTIEAGGRSTLSVPLISEGSAAGILSVTSREPNAYSERDLALMERIGAQIAGAIANAGLHAELRVRGVALEAAADMIVIADRDGTIEYVNEAFSRQTGYAKKEVVGRSPRILKSGRQDPAYYKDLWDTIQAGRVWNGTLVNRRKDGSEYPEEMTITPVPGADGGIARFIAIKRDISQRLRAEEERALRRRLDAENRELHRVNEAKSRFFSTVSHELKTPLTSIIAFTDLLARNRHGNLTSRQKTQLEVVQRNSSRLNDLIRDLLDVSRIDGGGLNLRPTEFDVRQLLEEVASDFVPVLREKGQKLERSMPDGELRIRGDQTRLAQVVSNLLSNASKYSPERSEIRLAAREDGGNLYIEVRDRGMGIAEEDMARLYTPFFRADNEATRSVSGTGLGLVITKAIIDGHRGDISIDSTPGVGTNVRVTIPRIAEQKAA